MKLTDGQEFSEQRRRSRRLLDLDGSYGEAAVFWYVAGVFQRSG